MADTLCVFEPFLWPGLTHSIAIFLTLLSNFPFSDTNKIEVVPNITYTDCTYIQKCTYHSQFTRDLNYNNCIILNIDNKQISTYYLPNDIENIKMDEEVKSRIKNTIFTKIICRSDVSN